MNSVQFATPGSGVLADKIGWIFYGTGAIFTPGAPPVHVINSIPGGGTVEFDLSAVNISGPINTVAAVHTPTYFYAAFGKTGYTGIPGDVALFVNTNGITSQEGVNLTNIVVKDANGVVQTNFKWVAADGETTDTDETWSVTTDGSPWSQLTVLPPVVPPANTPGVSGLGTSTVTQVGTGANHANGNVYITTAPKNVSARFFTYGREAVVFGIIFDPFETAVSQLIESVALEQTALSHILNAEGEKIQAALAKPGVSVDQLMEINDSVSHMVNSVSKLDMVIQSKLKTVLC